MTNVNRSLHDNLDYLPFGERLTGGTGTSHQFTGKERDSESGLDNFGDRYYSSPMGRFTSVDPIWVKIDRIVDPQRLNLYAYGRNNPLLFLDPDGRDVTIGRCSIGSAQDCFNKLQAGLTKQDREHVKLVTGDDKNGCAKGSSCVTVDADYKSDSKNFQVLQTLANDHSATATLDVLKPNDSFDLKTTISINVKTGEEKVGTLSTTPGFDGYTFFPYKKGDPGPFSPDDITHSVINSEPSDGDIPATIHHEMRHIFLGDFGRSAKKAGHGQPGVDQQTKAAEDEAKKNEKQN
jgi:RHS repeat-associated protein